MVAIIVLPGPGRLEDLVTCGVIPVFDETPFCGQGTDQTTVSIIEIPGYGILCVIHDDENILWIQAAVTQVVEITGCDFCIVNTGGDTLSGSVVGVSRDRAVAEYLALYEA